MIARARIEGNILILKERFCRQIVTGRVTRRIIRISAARENKSSFDA
jgi:hypothetical protein